MKRFYSIAISLIFMIGLNCLDVSGWCRRVASDTNTPENFSSAIARLVANSDFVFSGTLVEAKGGRMTFEVLDSWKGRKVKKITFNSYSYRPMDDNGEIIRFIDSLTFEFTVGKTYLVYANVNLDGFAASRCERTTELKDAGRDIEELNRQRLNQIAIVLPPDPFPPFGVISD